MTGRWSTRWAIEALFLLSVVGLVVASCIGNGGTFGQRCSKLYRDAAFERCVARLSNGGPLFEENIGRIGETK